MSEPPELLSLLGRLKDLVFRIQPGEPRALRARLDEIARVAMAAKVLVKETSKDGDKNG